MARQRYPDPPNSLEPDVRSAWADLTRELDTRDSVFYAPGDTKWVVTGVSITTSIDVASASDTYTSNLLASLIFKLAAKGII